MSNLYRPFITALMSCTVLTLSYAAPSLSMPSKSLGSYPKNLTIEQIVKDYQQGIMSSTSSQNALFKLNGLKQQRAELLRSLTNKLASDAKISSVIPTNKETQATNLLYQKDAENNPIEMNFLTVQIDEAAQLVASVPESIKASINILKTMRNIAVEVTTQTHSSSDIIQMDKEYQALKNLFSYVQHIDLKDGQKLLSGGDIMIQVGEDKNDSSTLVIPLPAFDIDSLNLSETHVDNLSNSHTAINTLNTAIDQLVVMSATINNDVIIDALVMLKSIPYILYQDYQIFDIAHALIMRSCNEVYSSSDQKIMDGYFDQIKLTLNKLQTYSSLRGTKMLGTGNLHIQIGTEAKPESTLVIKLPITDTKKSGLDQQHLYVPSTSDEQSSLSDSYKASHKALDNIVSIEHDFIYGKSGK